MIEVKAEDYDITTFCTGTAWVQKRNGVRILHKPSGYVEECADDASTYRNRQAAFEALQARLEDWNGRHIDARSNYRLTVGELVAAIQAAAIEGFPLQCVAAGSLWATVSLTDAEVQKLRARDICTMPDA